MESIDWRAEGDRCIALLQDLLRIPTVNRGTNEPGDGNERPAAERIAEYLREAGVEPRFFEKTPGRTNLVARLKSNPGKGDETRQEGQRRRDRARPAPSERAPRRRRGGRDALEAPPVRRRDPRRLALGARRDRHEAHGGDERVRRRPPRAREARPSARPHLRRRRRRRGGVQPGEPLSRQRPPRRGEGGVRARRDRRASRCTSSGGRSTRSRSRRRASAGCAPRSTEHRGTARCPIRRAP